MHLDHFWLFGHIDWVINVKWVILEGEVSDLSDLLGVVFLSFLAIGFGLLVLNGIFQLKSVFTGKVFEIFNVLKIYLFDNFLKILRLGPFHVGTEFELLFFGQQGDLVGH